MVKFSKIKGNSIIEVVVAIFIISMTIALSGVLFNNVFSSSDRMLKQRAWYEVNRLLSETLSTKNTEALLLEQDHYTVTKQSQIVDEAKGLWLIVFEAREPDEKLLVARKVYLEIPLVNEN